MFLKSTAGEYRPAYFIIDIDSGDPPETILEERQATFVHEYLHLLQDLVLPYCMRENIALLEKFFIQVAHARLNGEMRIPSAVSGPEVELVTRISNVTWGGGAFHRDVESIDRIDMTEHEVEGKEYRLHEYAIWASNVHGYHVGARDLLEYIAHKIESKHFPGEAKLPDLPYLSVDLILEHKGLAHLTDVKRVALAEYCLANDNPMRRLMVVIDDITQGSLGPVDGGDDHSFIVALHALEARPRGAPFRASTEKLASRLSALKETLQRQFHEDAFPAIHGWIDQVMQYSQDVLAGRGLFAWLYGLETDRFADAIDEILSKVGVPLVANNVGHMGTTLGSEEDLDQFMQLLLAHEFSEYIKQDETTCPLYKTCETTNPALIDDADCIDAPFRRALREDLCPFGHFAKATGLAQVRWFSKDRLIPSRNTDPFA